MHERAAWVRSAFGDGAVLLARLGHGGAGEVLHVQLADGDEVAVKVLHAELGLSIERDRFEREIATLRRLEHPRIARLRDAGECGGRLYYVMSFVAGAPLRELITRGGRLRLDDARRIAVDLLGALGYAHAHGIVHRDVKPENIVVAREGATLVDFGTARALGAAGGRVTRSGFAVGTIAYVSPEQARAEPRLDGRTDLYSAACVLFECLTGRPPYVSRSETALLQMRLHEDAPDVRLFRPDVPEGWARTLAAALARDPLARPRTAEAMLAQLPAS